MTNVCQWTKVLQEVSGAAGRAHQDGQGVLHVHVPGWGHRESIGRKEEKGGRMDESVGRRAEKGALDVVKNNSAFHPMQTIQEVSIRCIYILIIFFL